MDSYDIAWLRASLSISSRDGPIKLLNDKLMVEAKQKLSLCTVGKILSSRRVNKDAFMRVIGKIWQVKSGLDIESVSGNIFTFHFREMYDLERVISGNPWSFDNVLLAMEKPIGNGTNWKWKNLSVEFRSSIVSNDEETAANLCKFRNFKEFLIETGSQEISSIRNIETVHRVRVIKTGHRNGSSRLANAGYIWKLL
ncbi:hypothetical protein LWI28_019230 [Acer negundo]|uniref:DUF4283 domain-containing protein n=1 Tax=Acer negundo TaxID=4023 RepID=A0AAD5NQE5_ACENE|nr:hypothetical protein LWI28_019230 [Acer negundo]